MRVAEGALMVRIKQANKTNRCADILAQMEAALEEVFAYHKFGRYGSTFLEKPYFLLSYCAHLLFSLWSIDEDSGGAIFQGTRCPEALLAGLDFGSLRHVDGASQVLQPDASAAPLKNKPEWFDFWMKILDGLSSPGILDSQEFAQRVLAPVRDRAFLDGEMSRRDRRGIERFVKENQVGRLLLHSMSILEDAIWAMTSHFARLDSRTHVREQVLALTCSLSQIRRIIVYETPARGPYVPFDAKGWAMPSLLSRLLFGKTQGLLTVLLRREGGSAICTYAWTSDSVEYSRSWTFKTSALKGTYEQCLFRTWSYDTGECLQNGDGSSNDRACWMLQSSEAAHLRTVSQHAETLLSALHGNPVCRGLVEAVTCVVRNNSMKWRPTELPWTYIRQLDQVLGQLKSVCREAAVAEGDHSVEKSIREIWPVPQSTTGGAELHLSEGLQSEIPDKARVPPDENVSTMHDEIAAPSSMDAGPADGSEQPVPCDVAASTRFPMQMPSGDGLLGDPAARVRQGTVEESPAEQMGEQSNLSEDNGRGELAAPAGRPTFEAYDASCPDMRSRLARRLLEHHRRADGKAEYTPIPSIQLQRDLEWSRSKVQRVMVDLFGRKPFSVYESKCRDHTISTFLEAFAGERESIEC